eukprot:TRINITY_DN4017_c0_g1_i1.p2 TRINITY_DN4017_c0_g1~~TRINITY_DN4017_c0_g1_i1.p2  ORF type:complete len:308 (-),score=148.45 TRINITY_DN4017_c0_g1_i1:122-979(-)
MSSMQVLEQLSQQAADALGAPASLDWNRDIVQGFAARWRNELIIGWLVYCPLIFGLQRLMRDRAALELKPVLVLWNAGLAVFSYLSLLALLPLWLPLVVPASGVFSLSDFSCPDSQPQLVAAWNVDRRLWAVVLFALSKGAEYGDTILLALRKRPIITLHWTHHVLTYLQTAVNLYFPMDGITLSGTIINFFVHTIMYSYYALRALGIRVPRVATFTITILQTTQMFFVSAVLVNKWVSCPHGANVPNAALATAMYFYYVVQFSLLMGAQFKKHFGGGKAKAKKQ